MGWASANSIFDRTADTLIMNKVEPNIITDTLAALIDELTDHDWDTLDESIAQYKDVPAVMAAFRRAAPDWMDTQDEDADGDPLAMFEEEGRKLGWIAARLAWQASDLVHLMKQPGVTKADLLNVRDHPMGDPKIEHIEQAVSEFLALFPDIKTLDDARRMFGIEP